MQAPVTAPSNRFVKLSILHRDKGKSPGVPKLKNRTVKSQHYLNYQISLAAQIPGVKLSGETAGGGGGGRGEWRGGDVFVSETGVLVSEKQPGGEVIFIHMVTPQPFNYFN